MIAMPRETAGKGPSAVTMTAPALKTYIVVLNYNGWKDTLECLESLSRLEHPDYRVVVVDNNSQDDSLAYISAWAEGKLCPWRGPEDRFRPHLCPPVPKPVEYTRHSAGETADARETPLVLIQSGRNGGFAAGNNVGARYALTRKDCGYVWLLNNDTFVSPDSLGLALAFFSGKPEAALIGPKIYDLNDSYWQWPLKVKPGFFNVLCALSPFRRVISGTSFYRKFFYRGDAPQKVHAVVGCSLMFRREALEKIDLLDENTFLFWEEYIVAERLLKCGLPTYIVPEIAIWHKLSKSSSKLGANQFIESFRSERYFLKKYSGLAVLSQFVLLIVRLAAYLARMAVNSSYRRNFPGFLRVFSGVAVKHPTHVLQIVGEPVGGIRKHVHTLIRGLSGSGLKTSYVYSSLAQDDVFKADYPAISGLLSGRLFSLPISKRPGPADLLNLYRLYKYVKQEGVGLVHGHGAKGGAYARLLSMSCGVKCVYTPHGGAVHRMFGPVEEFLYSSAEKILFHFTDYFVFESSYSRDAYFAKIRRPAQRSIVNHNGISLSEPQKMGAEPEKPVYSGPEGSSANIGVFGILRQVKGQEYAIKAAAILRGRGIHVKLHFFGDGPDLEKLQALAAQSGIKGSVFFHGQVTRPEAHMSEMDIILIPSLFESFGYVALEAFSVKKPVIASNTGGLPEIVTDGEDGLLVSPADPAAISEAIGKLLAEPDLARRMGEKGYGKAGGKFALEPMLKKILSVYGSL